MNLFLRMACRVIERRMAGGEDFDSIITSYPKLTSEDIEEIKKELGV